jgi:DNA-binding transcriptional regulator PaaX
MSLRTKLPLTEQILAVISDLEDIFDIPRSMRQLVYRHEYEHWKLAKRRGAVQQRERHRIKKALWSLEQAEYLTATKKENGTHEYRLTQKGWLKFSLRYAQQLKKSLPSSPSPHTINKGAYVIIFDIPEEHRRFRDVFRQVLVNLGCVRLQKSIFLTHDISTTRLIARIVANCELEDRVKILLVRSIL